MNSPEILLQFPCSFPIKLMGRADAGFGDVAVRLIERHVDEISKNQIQTTTSRNGNFLSLTITIDAQSQEQLDNIYNDLSNQEDVLVTL
jgi:putative lipoic acid-binding regulatory protein